MNDLFMQEEMKSQEAVHSIDFGSSTTKAVGYRHLFLRLCKNIFLLADLKSQIPKLFRTLIKNKKYLTIFIVLI